MGSVNENNLDKQKFSYSISVANKNVKTIFIKSVQPTINERVKNKILSEETIVAVNKDIKPKETIEISGEIIIDTSGLTKEEIVALEPFITAIKISTEENINLKGATNE